MGTNYVEKQMKKLLIEEQDKLEREVQEAAQRRLKKDNWIVNTKYF